MGCGTMKSFTEALMGFGICVIIAVALTAVISGLSSALSYFIVGGDLTYKIIIQVDDFDGALETSCYLKTWSGTERIDCADVPAQELEP